MHIRDVSPTPGGKNSKNNVNVNIFVFVKSMQPTLYKIIEQLMKYIVSNLSNQHSILYS